MFIYKNEHRTSTSFRCRILPAFHLNTDSINNYNNNNNDLFEKDGGTKNCIYKD